MNIIESAILGLVQGLTEFIPVSSSGHLLVLGNLLGNSGNLHLFVQALDFGTTLALVIYFRHRLIDLARAIFIHHDYRLLRNVILTCLPVATIGLLLANFIEKSSFFTSSLVIAIAMATIGLIMIILDRLPRLSSIKDGQKLSAGRALMIGVAQCLALIPGTSRSGSTIIASRLMGLSTSEATEYSFLVSIPVMLGLTGKLLLSDSAYLISNWQTVLIGNIAAFLAGIIAIKYLLAYLRRHNLRVFGLYRVMLAGLIIICLASGLLPH